MRETDYEPPNGPDKQPTKPVEKLAAPERDDATQDDATQDDAVTEASEDSFPASDAPPWTSSTT